MHSFVLFLLLFQMLLLPSNCTIYFHQFTRFFYMLYISLSYEFQTFCFPILITCIDMLLNIQRSRCYCLSDVPDISDDMNDCRTECTNASYTPCGSGRSALVFSFVEGIDILLVGNILQFY